MRKRQREILGMMKANLENAAIEKKRQLDSIPTRSAFARH